MGGTALTLAELQAERERILSQIAEPENLQFEGRSIRNRPIQQLRESLALIDAEISKLQASGGRVFTVQTKRGIEA